PEHRRRARVRSVRRRAAARSLPYRLGGGRMAAPRSRATERRAPRRRVGARARGERGRRRHARAPQLRARAAGRGATGRRAHAADTQWWTSNTQADHAKAEARGVLVDAEGVLRAGPAARSFPTDSLTIAWCAVLLRDGSLAVGGDRGRVLRWSEKEGWRVWARLGPGQVLSLAADGDGAVAGTGPRGLVYRISPGGDTTRMASTGERYVWGLASAGHG